MIKDIYKRYLYRRFGRPRFKDLKLIAMDEISIRRGHRYLTVVLDLAAGAVVFVGEDRGADSLKTFWKRLKRCGARVEAAATDMLAAYVLAVTHNLPEAWIVFDRFHVIKLFNEKLSELRRELQREAEQMGKDVLKGIRWLLLKNRENLDYIRGERERLQEALP